jgi:plastocyanin
MSLWMQLGGTPAANWNLVLQIGLGIALLVGTFFARQQRIGAHRAVQTVVVVVNLALVFLVMLPSFANQGVFHHFVTRPGKPYFAVAFSHGVFGAAATLLSIYVVLSAGTNLLPAAIRMRNYKSWMRTTLALWLVALALGLATFRLWYDAKGAATETAPASQVASEPVVKMVDFKYLPETLTVKAGTTVTWLDSGGMHSVRSESEKFESDPLSVGQRFQHRFDKTGRYTVYCTLHGKDVMAGTIEVIP